MNNIPKGCRPFNLQECIEGKPVVTRSGKPYKFAGYNPDARDSHRLVGWIGEVAACHKEDGSFWAGSKDETYSSDLFMKAETKTLHHAIAKTAEGRYFTTSAHEDLDLLRKICEGYDWEIIKIYETEINL